MRTTPQGKRFNAHKIQARSAPKLLDPRLQHHRKTTVGQSQRGKTENDQVLTSSPKSLPDHVQKSPLHTSQACISFWNLRPDANMHTLERTWVLATYKFATRHIKARFTNDFIYAIIVRQWSNANVAGGTSTTRSPLKSGERGRNTVRTPTPMHTYRTVETFEDWTWPKKHPRRPMQSSGDGEWAQSKMAEYTGFTTELRQWIK